MHVLPMVFLITPLMSGDPVPFKNLVTVCAYKSFLLKTNTKQPISLLSLICSLNRNEIALRDCKAFFKDAAESKCFMGLVLPETGCLKSIHSSCWTSSH